MLFTLIHEKYGYLGVKILDYLSFAVEDECIDDDDVELLYRIRKRIDVNTIIVYTYPYFDFSLFVESIDYFCDKHSDYMEECFYKYAELPTIIDIIEMLKDWDYHYYLTYLDYKIVRNSYIVITDIEYPYDNFKSLCGGHVSYRIIDNLEELNDMLNDNCDCEKLHKLPENITFSKLDKAKYCATEARYSVRIIKNNTSTHDIDHNDIIFYVESFEKAFNKKIEKTKKHSNYVDLFIK